MKERHLGRSGLLVSRLGLGTMTWGQDTSPDEAAAQLIAFVEAGGTLVDTADVYNDGHSERILGHLLRELVDRDDLVVATKAAIRPNGRYDGSRRHLLRALDASLDRMDLDFVDLWQLHVYDPHTPLEETLSALDEAVSSGRARYVGVSNYAGWQVAKAAAWQRAWPGRAPVVSAQLEYSLLSRDIEREVVPAALDAGAGLLPWSPLGRGVLTGKYRTGIPAGSRAAAPHFAEFVQPYLDEECARIVESVVTAAEGLGCSPLAVALAWVRDREGVAAPIVGARTAAQLGAILASEEVTLPHEIRGALDDVSDLSDTTSHP
ncbi:aldo/keto reductase [Actinomadura sp. NPDC048955]|uniref:Aryl-alcohol dehydrogenase-like predicted oxidoreductase n=1 Tax=Actinomadura luteofluorescens TaxID=46163 RepID=A0A7Y9EAI0_9ACTN|nr:MULTISPECIES: aldo/keto reductase [Actinomadura]MCR3739226.1 putative oxidoreductase [Actinomadura glauciflava]NYD44118.1 aryl-alcohol dehydrogenase-like predicted oxidoreductase [Actinomadura luteofluorescens]